MSIRGFFIRLLGNKKQEEFKVETIKNVLIDGGRIGDLVTTTPLIKALAEMDENIRIDVRVKKGCDSLLWNHPRVNKIWILDNDRKVRALKIFKTLQSCFEIRKKGIKYDLYFDFADNIHLHHLLGIRILNPRYVIGNYRMEKFGIKKGELTLFDKYIKEYENDHIVDLHMRALDGFGIDNSNRKYELYLGELEEKYKDYFNKGKINIALNFLGSSPSKSLRIEDMEYFCREISKISEKIELHILTTPNIYEQIKLKLENLDLKNIKLLPKTKNILEAAAIIKYADMLFSVDTGVIHIASVYNIPIVALYPDDKDALVVFAPKSEIVSIIKGKKESFLKIFNKEEVLIRLKEVLKKMENINEKYRI